MKKVKNYIEHELAKKKIARYKYWSIKDENGVTICASDENNPDKKTFEEVLKDVMKANVDAEVQVRYGTSEQSSRQNPPYFIKVNEEIEWVEPESDDTVSINGVPHKVDKKGNVNINFTPPTSKESEVAKAVPIDTIRQELDVRLEGIQKEYELKEEKMKAETQNLLMEQTLKFREMMLAEREARLLEREQNISNKEQKLDNKEKEMRGDVVSYLKQVPSALGAIFKEFAKPKKEGLGKSNDTPKKKRKKAEFTIEEDEIDEVVENEITKYEEMEEEAEQRQESMEEDEEEERSEQEQATDFTEHSEYEEEPEEDN